MLLMLKPFSTNAAQVWLGQPERTVVVNDVSTPLIRRVNQLASARGLAEEHAAERAGACADQETDRNVDLAVVAVR